MKPHIRLESLAAAPLASLFLLLVMVPVCMGRAQGYSFEIAKVVRDHDCGDGRPLFARLLPGGRAILNTDEMSQTQLEEQLELAYQTRAERVLYLDADPDLSFQTLIGAAEEAHVRSDELHIRLMTSEARWVLQDPMTHYGCIW